MILDSHCPKTDRLVLVNFDVDVATGAWAAKLVVLKEELLGNPLED